MRSEIGVPATLDILREGAPMRVTLRPGPYPLALPSCRARRRSGVRRRRSRSRCIRSTRARGASAASALLLGDLVRDLQAGASRAAGVRAGAGRGRPRHHRRGPGGPRGFFREFADPFPALVATDPQRLTFQAYGVSGTPSFVLLDADGIVQYTQTGYRRQEGLRVEGWKWSP